MIAESEVERGGLTHELGEDSDDGSSSEDGEGVASVGGDDSVVLVNRRLHTDRNGLLLVGKRACTRESGEDSERGQPASSCCARKTARVLLRYSSVLASPELLDASVYSSEHEPGRSTQGRGEDESGMCVRTWPMARWQNPRISLAL